MSARESSRTYSLAANVRVVQSFVVEVTFADGTIREVDLEPELHGEVFKPLKDLAYFGLVSIDHALGVLTWPNGADFAPEFIYRAGRAKTSASA